MPKKAKETDPVYTLEIPLKRTASAENEQWFVERRNIERTERDVIKLKRLYIDICEGNLYYAAILSQIIYWFTPSKEGKNRLRVHREGKFWLAKRAREWYTECRVPEDIAQRAIVFLREEGLIETNVWKFGGIPTTHIHIPGPDLKEAIDKFITQPGLADESINDETLLPDWL